MTKLVYAFPDNDAFADQMAMRGGWLRRELTVHHFPDQETLVTLSTPEPGADVLLVCTLNHPDAKIFPLLQAASTLRELGAGRVTLVAPYLAYMRQDKRFHDGETVSSQVFGRLIAQYFDSVATVEPHLHRHTSLDDVGIRQGVVVKAAAAVAAWIQPHIEQPLIVGPDEESLPWARQIAERLRVPFIVGKKTRHDDNHVRIALPPLDPQWRGRTPVVVDDIVSSGHTMAECVTRLAELKTTPAVCIAMHGIGFPAARHRVMQAGAAQCLCTNTIHSRYAQVDISECMTDAVRTYDTVRESTSKHHA